MSAVATPIAGFSRAETLAALTFAENYLRDHLACEFLERAGDDEHPVIVLRDGERLRFVDVRLARVHFHPRVGAFDDAIKYRLRRAQTDWLNRRLHATGELDLFLRTSLDAAGVYLDSAGTPRVVEHVPSAY